MPVFEGVFPQPLDALVQKLLFCAANWQLLAKLHQHSSTTLHLLQLCTREYGHLIRELIRETATYKTKETAPEVQARQRRLTKANERSPDASSLAGGAKAKKLNINTFKSHNMGHIVSAILLFGTLDSYSTSRVSCSA